MTYKQVVHGFIERDSVKWLEKLLKENSIEFEFITAEKVSTEQAENKLWFYYSCELKIYKKDSSVMLEVGGTVDDYGIYHSVVWSDDHNIIWMSVPETRKELGIEQFKI